MSAVLPLEVLAAQQPSSPPAPAAPQLVVTLEARQLAIRAESVLLEAVLTELSTRTGIPIAAAPALDSDQISAQVKPAPIDQAIRELLKNYDAFFLYSGAGKQGLASVWVYPAAPPPTCGRFLRTHGPARTSWRRPCPTAIPQSANRRTRR